MKNLFLLTIIVFIFGCHSADERIDDSKTPDSVQKTQSLKNDEHKVTKMDKVNGEVSQLNEESFVSNVFDFKHNHEWIFAGTKPVIVDFYADWCGPCKKLSPTIEKLAKKYAGKIDVYKVNIDEQPTIAATFGIQSIPTVMFCGMKGKPLASTGYVDESELEKYISQITK